MVRRSDDDYAIGREINGDVADADASTFRSLSDFKSVMRQMGESDSKIDATLRALRELPVRF